MRRPIGIVLALPAIGAVITLVASARGSTEPVQVQHSQEAVLHGQEQDEETLTVLPTTVLCRGSICGGSGGTLQCAPTRRFVYRVRPNTAGNAVTKVEIGTDIANLNSYANICAPTGWSLVSIDSIQRAHDPVFNAHGTTTGQNGQCQFVMHWAGPGMTVAFELGFNMLNVEPHDVTWKSWASGIADGISNWMFPVGTGRGPVHGPQVDEGPPWHDPPPDD